MNPPLEVLVVGAGAVGQVFAYHLRRAGANVTFYVREKYISELAQGLTLYEMKMGSKHKKARRFVSFGAYHTLEQVRKQAWDMVILCMSSTGLVRDNWFEPFAQAVGEATLVSLQPGPEDRQYIEQYIDPHMHVQGMIGFIAFQAPLPGESPMEPGIAYLFPPGSPSPVSGHHAKAVAHWLNRGGLPSRHTRTPVSVTAGFPTAGLMPFLLGLEQSGWSFDVMEQGDTLSLVSKAISEASKIIGHMNRARVPKLQHAIKPFVLRPLLRAAPRVMPFDLELYLAYHFTKVGDQTRMTIKTYLRKGMELGMETRYLEELYYRLQLYERQGRPL